jgi:hypothetical protein
MTGNVTAIFGGPTGVLSANDACIATLERWLEMARSGEVIGVAVIGLCHDGLARQAAGGKIGGYSMIGALEVVRAYLIESARE